jgi:uncharacterized protein (TIGR03435 family)
MIYRFAVTAILLFATQTACAEHLIQSSKYARSQTAPTTRPEFEVASIRPSNPQWPQINVGVHVDGAQVRFSLFNLVTYIGYAYEIPPYQVEGPDWMGPAFFDIAAKIPEGANPTQVRAMLRTLLADRFDVKVHRETREVPVYALEIARGGLKMKELPPDPALDLEQQGADNMSMTIQSTGGVYNLGNGAYFSVGDKGFEAEKLSMLSLSRAIRPFLDRPVLDMTNLKGAYDFVLNVTPEDRIGMMIRSAINAGVTLPPQALKALDNASGDSFTAALEKIGLVLTPRKGPLEVIVVDSARTTPSDN